MWSQTIFQGKKKNLKTFGNIKLEKYNMTELFGTTIFMNEVN